MKLKIFDWINTDNLHTEINVFCTNKNESVKFFVPTMLIQAGFFLFVYLSSGLKVACIHNGHVLT